MSINDVKKGGFIELNSINANRFLKCTSSHNKNLFNMKKGDLNDGYGKE